MDSVKWIVGLAFLAAAGACIGLYIRDVVINHGEFVLQWVEIGTSALAGAVAGYFVANRK